MAKHPLIQPYKPRYLGPKDWGTELLVAHTEHYTGKVLSMRAGTSGPLQYHERKDETFHLYRGTGRVDFVTQDGKLHSVAMIAGESYHIPPGAIHRVHAVSDCVFFEASNPVFNDRVNVEAEYDK